MVVVAAQGRKVKHSVWWVAAQGRTVKHFGAKQLQPAVFMCLAVHIWRGILALSVVYKAHSITLHNHNLFQCFCLCFH